MLAAAVVTVASAVEYIARSSDLLSLGSVR
jgi:hypothetical protein